MWTQDFPGKVTAVFCLRKGVFLVKLRRKTGRKANLNYLLQFGSQIRNNLHHLGVNFICFVDFERFFSYQRGKQSKTNAKTDNLQVNLSTFHFVWEEKMQISCVLDTYGANFIWTLSFSHQTKELRVKFHTYMDILLHLGVQLGTF